MSIDIHLDRDKHELESARLAVAGVLLQCARLSPDLADKAAYAVLQALFDQFAGGRVYYPLKRAKGKPEIREAIEAELRAGRGCTEIAKDLKCSRIHVWRVRNRLAECPTLAAGLGKD